MSVANGSSVCRAFVANQALRCRRAVSPRGVRPDGVVVSAPALGEHPQLLHRVEDLSVEELVPHLRVEDLAVAVLPR